MDYIDIDLLLEIYVRHFEDMKKYIDEGRNDELKAYVTCLYNTMEVVLNTRKGVYKKPLKEERNKADKGKISESANER